MASDDSEDEIFFGPVISSKERKKMDHLRDRKTLLIDPSTGPLYRRSRSCDRSGSNNSLVVDHGSPAPVHLTQSDAIGASPSFGPQSSGVADTPTGPRESLLRVQQVLGETGCSRGGDYHQEDQKSCLGTNSAVITASEEGYDSAMDCVQLNNTEVEETAEGEMDCNNGPTAPNVTTGGLTYKCAMDVTPAQIPDDDAGESDPAASISFDLKCTNESSVYGLPKTGLLSSGYNSHPPFDFSHHVTGVDHQQASLMALDIASAEARSNCAAAIDPNDLSDFSPHDPSLYPVPAVHCDYGYLSNRFSIISTDNDASNAGTPTLPATKRNTTLLAEHHLISSTLPVNEQSVNDTLNAPLEDSVCKETSSLTLLRDDMVTPTTASSINMSSSSLTCNPALPVETSLKSNTSLASLQNSMEVSFVTPPPKNLTGRLALKVPSFSALSADEMVTPPPTALLRRAGTVEESDEDVATISKVVFELGDDSENETVPTPPPIVQDKGVKRNAVASPKPVVFGLDNSMDTRSQITEENNEVRSSVATSVSTCTSPVISVEDLSKMLDKSSLALLADVAIAEHEESMAVIDSGFQHPGTVTECPTNEVQHSKASVAPQPATPGHSNAKHCNEDLSSNKFFNEYLSPRPSHQAVSPAVTPGSCSSAVSTARTPATTPCSPAREKFLAFVRQWKEGNSAQKSPFKDVCHGVDDIPLKHKVVRNMMEELGTEGGTMDISENKLPNESQPLSCVDDVAPVEGNNECMMLNSDPVREGAANVVQAIQCDEENTAGAKCTKPRMSYFSSLDVIDVAKPELFGTFITEEGENSAAEQTIHTSDDRSVDSPIMEGDRELDRKDNDSSISHDRTATYNDQDQQSTLAKIRQHQQQTMLSKIHQYQQSTLMVNNQQQQSNNFYTNPEAGPSGLQPSAMYTSGDDTSYLEDYPSDVSGVLEDTSYDTDHPEHRFNDTLEQMELLLQASEKYKLEQAALQQQLALEEAATGEDQMSDRRQSHSAVSNEEQLPPSSDGDEEQLPSTCDAPGLQLPSTGNTESHLATSIDSDEGCSDSDATLGNESISICDVVIDETDEGVLAGLAEAEAMGDDVRDYIVLSPKKRTVASEVFDSAFNPTMDSTHASCARLSPEFVIRTPSPNEGVSTHCLPPMLSGDPDYGSFEQGAGKVIIGNACVVEEYEEFDESNDLVEKDAVSSPVPVKEIFSRSAGTTSHVPASSYDGLKETPIKPPRKINAAKADIKSLPVAVVSPSITRSSSATRENSSGSYETSNYKDTQRSSNMTNTGRSHSASRLHLPSSSSTKTTPSTTMSSLRSPVRVSRLHNSHRTPNIKVNSHTSLTGNIPRSVVDNKPSCSRSPFKTPSRPMTTHNKNPSTSSLTAPRPSQHKTSIPSHIPRQYLTPQSRQVSGVLTTNSARKVHVGASGSRVQQLAVATPTYRVTSPVARSLLVNPPPPLLTTVKPRTSIDEHRLMQTAAESAEHPVRHYNVVTPRRGITATPSSAKLNQVKVQDDLNSSMQQRTAKIDRIQKGLDRLAAKSPKVGHSPCPVSPSGPPPSPNTRRCPTLPATYYSQPSNLCVESDKENKRMHRPCCAHGNQSEEEEDSTKPRVLRHTGRVLMPQSAEAVNTSQSLMEVSMCERHPITYTDTLRAKQQHH